VPSLFAKARSLPELLPLALTPWAWVNGLGSAYKATMASWPESSVGTSYALVNELNTTQYQCQLLSLNDSACPCDAFLCDLSLDILPWQAQNKIIILMADMNGNMFKADMVSLCQTHHFHVTILSAHLDPICWWELNWKISK